jgi:hypothetical protein
MESRNNSPLRFQLQIVYFSYNRNTYVTRHRLYVNIVRFEVFRAVTVENLSSGMTPCGSC